MRCLLKHTRRTHAPLTRLMRCSSTVTIVMLSSSCNLDRHIIRLSSSCDFNKTHHHAITMRRRLTHARSFNTARTHAQTTRRMPCFSMENSPCYHHHIVMLSLCVRLFNFDMHIVMLSSSCDFDRHIVMLSSSCEFDRHIVMLSSSCEFDRHIVMLSQSILFYQSNSTSESQDDDRMMCMSNSQDDGSMMMDVSVELNFRVTR
jgi:hypothetical protein